MSFAFPYFGFPSFRRYYRKNPHYTKKEEAKTANESPKSNKSDTHSDSGTSSQRSDKADLFGSFKTLFTDGIDLFGIHLNSDDILIIGVLFLLYTEGVKDQSLFISLIMLLLDNNYPPV